MPIWKGTILYAAQAIFWLWLAREVMRDRPRGAKRLPLSVAWSWRDSDRLWQWDADVTRTAAWTALFLSTVLYVVFLVDALRP